MRVRHVVEVDRSSLGPLAEQVATGRFRRSVKALGYRPGPVGLSWHDRDPDHPTSLPSEDRRWIVVDARIHQ